MKSSDIRQTFLDYFVRRGHTLVPSSSLVPLNDPTLLFTNAGMVQFKHVLLGQEQRSYSRACSSQKCLRVSGKHNDIESVGPSSRHHTFFEMLGNFSFVSVSSSGSRWLQLPPLPLRKSIASNSKVSSESALGGYFKRDAMRYAWELLTEEFKLPVERLWVTVHNDDDEAARLWEEIGVERERILRFGDKENFWSMGETGPCGPSSEIHYYQGSDSGSQRPEGVNSDDDDYWELWNLVFVQFNRDEQGILTPLPRPSIDTGMGLERLTAVIQGVQSDYQTDLFTPLLHRLMELTGKENEHYRQHFATYNAIADHSRAVAFLIADGIQPGNGGRNYVLRRLIRRASYFGQTIGLEQPFLSQLAQVVIDQMGDCYPELQREPQRITDLTTAEEIRFQRTLAKGLRFLEMSIASCQHNGILSGHEAFKLYDTYGFPLDLTQKILSERGLQVNIQEYEEERVQQQQRSRNAAR